MGNFKVLIALFITTGRSVIVSSNIVNGRQLRAARAMARLTQRELAIKSGFRPRAAKYWERQDNKLPTDVPQSLAAVERILREHGGGGL